MTNVITRGDLQACLQRRGIGLAIYKGIVDRHGGRSDVRSTTEDATSITVWLPVGGPA